MESTFDFILIRNTFVTKFVIKNVSVRLIYLISQLFPYTVSFKARVIHQIISEKLYETRFGNKSATRIFQHKSYQVLWYVNTELCNETINFCYRLRQ
jgi:hypothetical protein